MIHYVFLFGMAGIIKSNEVGVLVIRKALRIFKTNFPGNLIIKWELRNAIKQCQRRE